MKRQAIIVTVAVVTALLLGGFGYMLYQSSRSEPQPTNDVAAPAKEQQQAEQKKQGQSTFPEPTPPEQVTYPIKVYFSKHPESDDDPARTFALARTSPDLGVAKFAVTELLKGPTPEEATQGYFSYAKLRGDQSNCQGADFMLNISNKTATLQFCKTFDHIGSVSDGQAESVIKDTLNQFDTVDKVVILNKNGDCEFNLSGLNLCKQ